jgi:hypothetical protein
VEDKMINPQISRIGNQRWYDENGQYHRTDGPAVILHNNVKRWYLNGHRYYDNKSFQLAADLSDEDMIAIVLKYGNVE